MHIHVYDPSRHALDTESGRTIQVPAEIGNESSDLLEAESVASWARQQGYIRQGDLVACL